MVRIHLRQLPLYTYSHLGVSLVLSEGSCPNEHSQEGNRCKEIPCRRVAWGGSLLLLPQSLWNHLLGSPCVLKHEYEKKEVMANRFYLGILISWWQQPLATCPWHGRSCIGCRSHCLPGLQRESQRRRSRRKAAPSPVGCDAGRLGYSGVGGEDEAVKSVFLVN